jgi:hypothetical protein
MMKSCLLWLNLFADLLRFLVLSLRSKARSQPRISFCANSSCSIRSAESSPRRPPSISRSAGKVALPLPSQTRQSRMIVRRMLSSLCSAAAPPSATPAHARHLGCGSRRALGYIPAVSPLAGRSQIAMQLGLELPHLDAIVREQGS